MEKKEGSARDDSGNSSRTLRGKKGARIRTAGNDQTHYFIEEELGGTGNRGEKKKGEKKKET